MLALVRVAAGNDAGLARYDGPERFDILPLLVATAWGQFVAPRAPRYLRARGRLVVEAAVFGTAAMALVGLGRPRLAEGLALLAALNTALVHCWGQDLHARVVAADQLPAAVHT